MPRMLPYLLILCFAVVSLPASSLAEDNGETSQQQTSQISAMPTRGMLMKDVKQHFGLPLHYHPAVGDPPIIRWEYAGFVVYFEDKYVIHSVATGNKQK